MTLGDMRKRLAELDGYSDVTTDGDIGFAHGCHLSMRTPSYLSTRDEITRLVNEHLDDDQMLGYLRCLVEDVIRYPLPANGSPGYGYALKACNATTVECAEALLRVTRRWD